MEAYIEYKNTKVKLEELGKVNKNSGIAADKPVGKDKGDYQRERVK